jgi:hypothetical protein
MSVRSSGSIAGKVTLTHTDPAGAPVQFPAAGMGSKEPDAVAVALLSFVVMSTKIAFPTQLFATAIRTEVTASSLTPASSPHPRTFADDVHVRLRSSPAWIVPPFTLRVAAEPYAAAIMAPASRKTKSVRFIELTPPEVAECAVVRAWLIRGRRP